jgi:O-antigen/teichoic acid export membrane protein
MRPGQPTEGPDSSAQDHRWPGLELGEETAPAGSNQVRNKFGHDALWSYLLQGGRITATTAVTFVLAKALGPEAFGIVALAVVYTALVQMVFQDPVINALVQRKHLFDEHKDVAFWSVCIVSLVTSGTTVLMSGLVASFYGLPALAGVLSALALCVPIRALTVVHEALLQRDLRFKSLTVRTYTSVLVGGAAGIAAAYAGAGVWALVVQQIITAAVGSIALWLIQSFRPRLRWSSWAARDLVGFSTHLALSNVGVFLGSRADVFVMGYFFGPFAVGIYRLAFRLVDTVLAVTATSIQTVSFPHLASLQGNPHAFGRRLLVAHRMVAVTTLPLLGVLASAAEPIVRLLGSDWSGAVPVLRVLCLATGFTVISQLTGPTLAALGRPGLVSAIYWSRGLIGVAAFVTIGAAARSAPVVDQLVYYGLAFGSLQAITGVVSLLVLQRNTGVSARRQLGTILPATLAALLATSIGFGRHPLGLATLVPVADLAVTGTIAIGVSALAILVLDNEVRGVLCRLIRLVNRSRGV